MYVGGRGGKGEGDGESEREREGERDVYDIVYLASEIFKFVLFADGTNILVSSILINNHFQNDNVNYRQSSDMRDTYCIVSSKLRGVSYLLQKASGNLDSHFLLTV